MLTVLLIVLAVLMVLGAVAAVALVCGTCSDGSFLGWFISWQAMEAILKVTLYVLGIIFQAIADAQR